MSEQTGLGTGFIRLSEECSLELLVPLQGLLHHRLEFGFIAKTL
jgi:hypothetical protein